MLAWLTGCAQSGWSVAAHSPRRSSACIGQILCDHEAGGACIITRRGAHLRCPAGLSGGITLNRVAATAP